VLWAQWLATEVLAPVAHHQRVFTVPKRLRLYFLYDRRLLGDLSRCAWETVRELYRAGLDDRRAVPGMWCRSRRTGIWRTGSHTCTRW
jgi:hypothetical protein